uniref:Copine C-terminal domain-containing protein n=1 Tax=Timema tahoe TaxID=61484 RepID=A0A7R9P0L8_9NEOP|nr:unnamed protein product [Timema tahoe]
MTTWRRSMVELSKVVIPVTSTSPKNSVVPERLRSYLVLREHVSKLKAQGTAAIDYFLQPGVLEAYKSCIRQIQLFGPTNFAPVINHVAKFAESYSDGSQYFILLIITDGVITDMVQTKQACKHRKQLARDKHKQWLETSSTIPCDEWSESVACRAIIRASALPMSIIIVGVGRADFDAMNELDGDTVPVSHNGVQAKRDIVQFVPFRNFESLQNVSVAKAYLAKEVLEEIPDQIVGYMKGRNVVPKLPATNQMKGDAPPPPYPH